MIAEVKFPVTLMERIELGEGIVRIPATWEEYLDLLEECEYQIEYDNQHIIAMSIATNPHETMVVNLSGILFQIFGDDPGFNYASSNRHIYSLKYQKDFAPDAHVVKGEPQEYTLRKGLTANLNPYILFEILSPSTRYRDLNEKLPVFKEIPSARQIIYLEQTHYFATVYTRIGNTDKWEKAEFRKPEQTFLLDDKQVRLKDFYKKVIFMGGQ